MWRRLPDFWDGRWKAEFLYERPKNTEGRLSEDRRSAQGRQGLIQAAASIVYTGRKGICLHERGLYGTTMAGITKKGLSFHRCRRYYDKDMSEKVERFFSFF